MFIFALDYHLVIDDITANKALRLCQYELDEGDWDIIKDLLKVLKVCLAVTFIKYSFNLMAMLDVQRCNIIFLSR